MDHGPVTQFAEALRAAGFILKGEPVFDNRIYRVSTVDKPHHTNGHYSAKFEHPGKALGWYQNMAVDAKRIPFSWFAEQRPRLTRDQRRHLDDERAAAETVRAQQQLEQQERAAAECQARWDGAAPVETHPYPEFDSGCMVGPG
jgi:hypothetical protein